MKKLRSDINKIKDLTTQRRQADRQTDRQTTGSEKDDRQPERQIKG
jgi:hypothetical protein